MNNTDQQAKRDKWKTLIAEYEISGLSQVEFCKQNELSLAQFSYYRGALKPEQRTSKNPPSTFVPVKVNQQAAINEMRVILPNGFQFAFPSEIESSRIKELIGVFLSC